MSFSLANLGLFLRRPDDRPPRQVEGDIAEELAFHLDERTRDNRATGMDESAARADALRRFGDFESIRSACRRIDLGERIMLQRLNLIVMFVLLGCVIGLGWMSLASQRQHTDEVARLREEMQQVAQALRERAGTVGALMGPQEKPMSDLQVAQAVRELQGRSKPPTKEQMDAAMRILEGAGSAIDAATRDRQSGVQALGYAGEHEPAGDSSKAASRIEPIGYVSLDGEIEDLSRQIERERSEGAPDADRDTGTATWRARFQEKPQDWRHGLAIAQRLADSTSCEHAAEVMAAVWPELSVPQREQAFKPFVFGGGKPCALAILHLGATDSAPSVRERAYSYLKDYAFEDFGSQGMASYLSWYQRFGKLPLVEVFSATAPALVLRFLNGSSGFGADERAFSRLDLRAAQGAGYDAAATMRSAGALDLIQLWLAYDSSDANQVEAQIAAVRWLDTLEFDEATQRALLLPILSQPDKYASEVLAEVCNALGKPEKSWAVPPLLDFVQDRVLRGPDGANALPQAVRALGEIGDPRATPVLISWIVTLDAPVAIEGIGSNGLSTLTGVPFDREHDGPWWKAWWEANRATQPKVIRDAVLADPRSPEGHGKW